MKSFLAALLFLTTSALAQTPSQKLPFTFEDMMKLKRVGAPVPSPDGKWVVFDCVDVDLEANRRISHLWIVPASGGESRRLNPTPNHEERPRFSPDGKRLIWTSKATEPTQIWMCDFDTGGGALVGKPHQLTEISTGADGGIWSPDGKNIVFVSAVYPDCKDDACNKQRDEELKKSKVKAKIFSRLFYRHWSAFTEFKRSHLFVIPADTTVEAGVSPAQDFGAQPTRLPPQNRGFELRLIGSLQSDAVHLKTVLADYEREHHARPASVLMCIGPEGDFTPAELNLARSNGCRPITLGPIILRVETAAIYCLSVLSYELLAAPVSG